MKSILINNKYSREYTTFSRFNFVEIVQNLLSSDIPRYIHEKIYVDSDSVKKVL